MGRGSGDILLESKQIPSWVPGSLLFSAFLTLSSWDHGRGWVPWFPFCFPVWILVSFFPLATLVFLFPSVAHGTWFSTERPFFLNSYLLLVVKIWQMLWVGSSVWVTIPSPTPTDSASGCSWSPSCPHSPARWAALCCTLITWPLLSNCSESMTEGKVRF